MTRQLSLTVKTIRLLLKDYERNACEGKLNEKEALDALKTMEPEKTPGTDGLPAEFYKVFWRDISSTLIDALNYAYETVKLIPN